MSHMKDRQTFPVYDCHPNDLDRFCEPIGWAGCLDEDEAEVIRMGLAHYEGTGANADTVGFVDDAWFVYSEVTQ